MWWPQVRKPTNAMPSVEYAIALYEYGFLWLKVGTTSLMTPIAGQDHDVDGRVRVEPEEVLVEHRVAAARRVEEPPVEPVVDADDGRARWPRTGVASTWMMLVP